MKKEKTVLFTALVGCGGVLLIGIIVGVVVAVSGGGDEEEGNSYFNLVKAFSIIIMYLRSDGHLGRLGGLGPVQLRHQAEGTDQGMSRGERAFFILS